MGVFKFTEAADQWASSAWICIFPVKKSRTSFVESFACGTSEGLNAEVTDYKLAQDVYINKTVVQEVRWLYTTTPTQSSPGRPTEICGFVCFFFFPSKTPKFSSWRPSDDAPSQVLNNLQFPRPTILHHIHIYTHTRKDSVESRSLFLISEGIKRT